MVMLPKGYLFTPKGGKVKKDEKLFVRADRYYPDSPRLILLFEAPCAENNNTPLAALARYVNGKYYGTDTDNRTVAGAPLPIMKNITTWTESSIAEGPYRIAFVEDHRFYGDFSYEDFQSATNHVNNLNMEAFGENGYTVVNQYGIPVDSNGHLYF